MAEKKTHEQKESEAKAPEEKIDKNLEKREDKQLFWFVAIILIIFASFLIPYFHVQSLKSFDYVGANWRIEDYNDLKIFHARFQSFNNINNTHNLYLRIDPRENNVETTGTFDNFKYGGVLSFSPEFDACRGDVSRATTDLASYVKSGIGVDKISIGSTNKSIAEERSRIYGVCNTVLDRTLIILDIGNESKVVQDEKYKSCYTIYAKNCDDISSMEKFMTKSLNDMNELRARVIANSTEGQ